MGRTYSVLRAADYAANLPPGGAVDRRLNPEQWTRDQMIAASQADALNWLVWSKTRDGQKNRNRPKPIPRPGVDDGKGRVKDAKSMPIDELKQFLARPRTPIKPKQ